MTKLDSVPLYPITLLGAGIPVNLVLNKTSKGKFQIAKVNNEGNDFDVLKEFDNEPSAREYAAERIRQDFPGLI
jgi:hypothetical protein